MNYVDKGAIISSCGKYRYRLWREWRGTHDSINWRWLDGKPGHADAWGEPKACVFIMLNPSTADANVDDPTIRRCVSFAAAWRYERLEVVNHFAYRATNPKEVLELAHQHDPVGYRNQDHVYEVSCKAGLIVCAWGAHGGHLDQDETMLGWLPRSAKPQALGFTAAGLPKHPLYVPGNTELVPMRPRTAARRPAA